MPTELEERLHNSALSRGYKPGSEQYNTYVHGTMKRIEEQRRKRKPGAHGPRTWTPVPKNLRR